MTEPNGVMHHPHSCPHLLAAGLLLAGASLAAPPSAAQGGRWARHVMAVRPGAMLVGAGDINGDGRPDAVVAGRTGLSWYDRGLGASFWPAMSIARLPQGSSTSSLALHDMDGDGDLDLVAVHRAPDEVAWYENPRAAAGAPAEAVSSPPTAAAWRRHLIDRAPGATAIALEDISRNGRLDLVVGSTRGIWWLPIPRNPADLLPASYSGQRASRRFWQRFPLTHSRQAGLAQKLSFGDLDGDGDRDLAVAEPGNASNPGRLVWFERPSDGTLVWSERLVREPMPGATSFFPADVDRDGKIDMVYVRGGTAGIGYLPAADPAVERLIDNDGLPGPRGVTFVDLDRDGDQDLVAGSLDPARLVLWRNSGGGEFELQVIDAAQPVADLAPADIDGDGDLDLFVAGGAGGDLVWYENLGG